MEQTSTGGLQDSCTSVPSALLGRSLSATLVASSLWGDESVCSDGVGGCERWGKQAQLWSWDKARCEALGALSKLLFSLAGQ